jgi:hypothetical protein
LLRNPTYTGVLTWGRRTAGKDPATGVIVRHSNAPHEAVSRTVPELRVIEQPLWDRVQARLAAGRVPARGGGRPAGIELVGHLAELLRAGVAAGAAQEGLKAAGPLLNAFASSVKAGQGASRPLGVQGRALALPYRNTRANTASTCAR